MTKKRVNTLKEVDFESVDEGALQCFLVSKASSSNKTDFKSIASRINRSSVNEDYDFNDTIAGELNNLTKGVSPMEEDDGSISVATAIELCQKAYWNVPIFRNTIDIQTEFANSKLHFRGDNKKTNKFYKLWYDKVGGSGFSERWFREFFRSCNIFLYKFSGNLTLTDYRQMSRAAEGPDIQNYELPLRYVILNPRDIRCNGSASFSQASYVKILNNYEISRLKNPGTEEELEFFNSLPEETRKNIQKNQKPTLPLDPSKLIVTFCGKQDYEAMAIPMYYPVLPDIDQKLEFKKAEKVIARTVDYAILLITAGSTEREALSDGRGVKMNNALLTSLKTMFETESVGRVLVSDFTTKGQFIIPDLNKIFGSEKYKTVNEDIANGLMNIFWGEEKFANSMVKIKVFLERLKSARDSYLNNFLIPEMKLIAKKMKFQSIPTPEFEEVDLKDELEYMKLYTRLGELGLLTPDELFNAYESHNLPLKEGSIENQREYKSLRDKGLYQPLLGGPKNAEGRPAGTKAPQTTKKVSPIGGSTAEIEESPKVTQYSLSKIGDCLKEVNLLSEAVENIYKNKYGLKRISKKHKETAWFITESIIMNVPRGSWDENIEQYFKNGNKETLQADEIYDLAATHEIDICTASLLFHSKLQDSQDNK